MRDLLAIHKINLILQIKSTDWLKLKDILVKKKKTMTKTKHLVKHC